MSHPPLHTVPDVPFEIDLHRGPRDQLWSLFALAEDSSAELERYWQDGRVLIARSADLIIGHLQLVWTDEPGVAEIKNMAVVESRRRSGVGSALVRVATELLASERASRLRVATASADVTNLRFYQQLGFRLSSIERDAFDAANGYAPSARVEGIDLRDRVWLDRSVAPPAMSARVGLASDRDGNRTDRQLISDAARRIGIPRIQVPPAQESFVLHAPLELLARSTLLAGVAPSERTRARDRIGMLVAGYETAAPALSLAETTAPASTAEAIERFVGALQRRDSGDVDVTAHWLDLHLAGTPLAQALAPIVLPTLAAAGHGNIYLALLNRPALVPPSCTMVRSVAHELVTDPAPSMRLPELVVDPDHERATDALMTHLRDLEPIGAATSPFIAPLVLHAEHHGLLDRLSNGRPFAAPGQPPMTLLRFAAQAMLQGNPEHAPYGWTHCLTLAQGALRCARLLDNPVAGTYVAMAYLVAHWAAYGADRLDMEFVPPAPRRSLAAALVQSPIEAAGAAWHATDREAIIRVLATAASVNHDAHRVKYTLACIDASVDDPGATSLYLAAAAYLNAWWELHGDSADPLR